MTANYEQEATLIADLIAQKPAAFEYLVKTYYVTLSRVAIAIAGPDQAEGIVQEAWISILKALPKFQGRSTLKTWMCRIVANQAKTRIKKNSRTENFDHLDEDLFQSRFKQNDHWQEPPVEWDYSTPEQVLEESQLKKCIAATLKKLTDMQQAVFSMRYMQNYSLSDICNILDVTDSNVRVILHRSRHRLLETIERFQVTGEC